MSAQKVFVTQAETAVIECPKCETRKNVPVGHFKGKKYLMNVKCACSHLFEVELNFRRHYRKTTNLDGHYQNSNLNIKGHYDNLSQDMKISPNVTNCIINDISLGGVSINIIGKHLIEVDNKLMVTFHLDNKRQTLIQRQVIVKRVDGSTVGAEFFDTASHDPELGFYLMP